MHYLVSCSIVKNEQDYILDFIEYHKFIGIEHFIFYDRSTPSLRETLRGRTDVTIIDFPEPGLHAEAWELCIRNYSSFSKWIALFDIDEFFVPKHHTDLKVLLQSYEQFGALGVNWQTFGSNGHITKPQEPQLIAFNKKAKVHEGMNAHIQSIIQPAKALPIRPADPHHVHLKPGHICVNEKYKQINGPFSNPISVDLIQMNHYYTRSVEEYTRKRAKGRADINGAFIDLEFLKQTDAICNEVEDNLAADIYRKMKNA